MPLLTPAESSQIETAVASAECRTSAEIKVVVVRHCWTPILEKAQTVFRELRLVETSDRNAVLILVVAANREFVIYGDKGINNSVPDDFWTTTRDAMNARFAAEGIASGIVTGVTLAGAQLQSHFPADESNPNEVSNDVIVEK